MNLDIYAYKTVSDLASNGNVANSSTYSLQNIDNGTFIYNPMIDIPSSRKIFKSLSNIKPIEIAVIFNDPSLPIYFSVDPAIYESPLNSNIIRPFVIPPLDSTTVTKYNTAIKYRGKNATLTLDELKRLTIYTGNGKGFTYPSSNILLDIFPVTDWNRYTSDINKGLYIQESYWFPIYIQTAPFIFELDRWERRSITADERTTLGKSKFIPGIDKVTSVDSTSL
jgi:hypothetical protein